MHDMQRRATIDKSYLLVRLFALALVAINILRILYVPITHDEALTYSLYVTAPWLDIVSIHPTSANDHILNSLLAKVFMLLFGSGQFALRLTNVLAQISYMYFSFRIVRHLFTDRFLVVAGFLLLNLNPFLFEYWGLCRGYGLSIALMMGSVYYLLRYLQCDRPGLLWCTMLMAMLAVYANYALLYFFLALPVVVAYSLWCKGDRGSMFFKAILPVLLSSLLLFLTVVGNIKALNDDGQLYYGGDNGIVHDTIASLVRESLYLAPGTALLTTSYAIVALLLGIGLYFVRGALRKRDLNGISLYLLLALPLLATALQHCLSGSKLLIERTALFFIPLFILQLIYALAYMPKITARIVFSSMAVLVLINFALHTNLDTARSWPGDAPVLQVLDKMREHSKDNAGMIKVRASWQSQPALQYYVATKYNTVFTPIAYDKAAINTDTAYNYYYIYYKDIKLFPLTIPVDTLQQLDSFVLFKTRMPH